MRLVPATETPELRAAAAAVDFWRPFEFGGRIYWKTFDRICEQLGTPKPCPSCQGRGGSFRESDLLFVRCALCGGKGTIRT